ncbi:MAG: Glycogen synthase [Candidatus Magasanikbacteria bacterium GW2011_GWA2_41_55]|uniref:Glycogen synthase n=1 Tax=Candidatus Magasanikbacteria bacterium GW2011_GWA2_41_55 TaxID=1619038 RepID=A0A0G0YUU1_9BACT|nr:MAG: Glycogen synthase [Candidatus Magasanikbacteria bacterium GW2011_GWA2_41_55]
MKILFLNDFIPPRNIGGPGFRNFEVAQELFKRGNEVYFITSCQKREQEGEETKDGIKIFNVYSNYNLKYRNYVSVCNLAVLGKIKKIIKKLKPDITHVDTVHIHLSYASIKIAKKYSKAVFLTSRDFMLYYPDKFIQKEKICGETNYKVNWLDNLKVAKKRYNPFRNIMIKRYLKYVDKIFAISEEMKKALNQNGIINVDVLYNSLPIPQKEPSYMENNSKIIFSPSRTSESKGVYALLATFPLIKKDVADAKILIVGTTKDRKKRILEYMDKNNISKENVEILGWINNEEVKSIYGKISVVVTPSLYPDPLLGVNLEAALYKKPVVTTCFGGAKEFVVNGETGYVVNPYDTKEMAEKITDILLDGDKAKQFGEAGYKRLKEKFSINIQTDKLLNYYNKLQKAHC